MVCSEMQLQFFKDIQMQTKIRDLYLLQQKLTIYLIHNFYNMTQELEKQLHVVSVIVWLYVMMVQLKLGGEM